MLHEVPLWRALALAPNTQVALLGMWAIMCHLLGLMDSRLNQYLVGVGELEDGLLDVVGLIGHHTTPHHTRTTRQETST